MEAKMKSWIWTGAAYKTCKTVPLTDRGFRYGMSVFESLRVNAGGPEFFDKHLARIIQACAERDIPVDESGLAAAQAVLSDPKTWRALLRQRPDSGPLAPPMSPARKPKPPEDLTAGFARIYVTAGDGGPATLAEHPRIFVFIEPRTPPGPDDAWEVGLHDESYQPLFGGLKTANYWFNSDALAQARLRKFDETILFNDRAEVVSACCANIFVVRDDRLCTPPRSSGCRAGVILLMGHRPPQSRGTPSPSRRHRQCRRDLPHE
ncbi:Branched-chain amino acid aminotransferase/4-amino-4-deoxychorismate lyase-like protein [Chthoniobacter flavus Ellin428]|uniref:branched-chain-amino-acid transaminase n=2 Tax=Chthoniobacter flavus TaxID=191863 RepID=B4CX10_9BACT|nr:Branched-chain amino acid aminotransferase/4-amino-4-deoxychorismate lyase-like protein [Chthoniobacter flavus Ellin428]